MFRATEQRERVGDESPEQWAAGEGRGILDDFGATFFAKCVKYIPNHTLTLFVVSTVLGVGIEQMHLSSALAQLNC